MPRRIAIVALLVSLAACTGRAAPDGGGGDTTTTTPGRLTPLVVPALSVPSGRAGIPGVYLPVEIMVGAADGSGAVLLSALPCDATFAALAAGEWDVVSDTEPGPELAFLTMFQYGFTRAMVLERRGERLLARGTGQMLIVDEPEEVPPPSDDCIVHLTRLYAAPLTLTGAMPVEGSVTSFPLRCVQLADSLAVSMGYQAPGSWVSLTFELPSEAVGEHPILGGSLELSGLPLDVPPWEMLETLVGVDDDFDDDFDDDALGFEAEAIAEVVGTATVTSADPLQGTVVITEIISSWDGTSATLEASFSCPTR